MNYNNAFLLVLIFTFTVFNSDNAQARRKKKYKGPIIVNQILRLSGTMTDNGNPTMEFAGIKEGDVLETAPHSAAVIRIPGLGIYRLGENTKLKLSKFGGRDTTRFDLEKGDLLCIYKRLGSHEVKTENALVSPNGNSPSNIFWITDIAKKAIIDLWDGKISIKARNIKEVPKPEIKPDATPDATIIAAKNAAVVSAGAQIAASNVPVDSKQDPPKTPTAVATTPPVAPSGFVPELTVSTTDSLKKYLVTEDNGVAEKEESGVNAPDPRFIKELESLYALP